MSRKQYSKELKLELVKKHLEDGISYWKLGKEYGIEASIIRRWGHKHETFGEDGLEKQNADLCNYSAEFKKKIVLECPNVLRLSRKQSSQCNYHKRC